MQVILTDSMLFNTDNAFVKSAMSSFDCESALLLCTSDILSNEMNDINQNENLYQNNNYLTAHIKRASRYREAHFKG